MKRIAVIGSGIAGLTAAHYLSTQYRVHLFEATDYIGGHTHTVDVTVNGVPCAVDTGFIVFNDRTYPHFMHLLDELAVPFQKTEMSFSVRNDAIGLEYNGHTLDTLFAQRKNLVSPSFWRMLMDIVRFNRQVKKAAADPAWQTLGEYLDARKFGSLFRDNYLFPMVAAIWSMGLDNIRDFPLPFFVRFFDNHGLLNLVDRPQWYTITGGSRSYIPKITARFTDRIHLSSPVRNIVREPDGIRVKTDKDEGIFDHVVAACHADQALALLDAPADAETRVLQNLPFIDNQVALHTDTRILPRIPKARASWNYNVSAGHTDLTTLTYNMNILQQLDLPATCLVTLNQEIAAQHVVQDFTYAHPAYTPATIEAQQQWDRISGPGGLHFCGAYWFNGFHEDGVKSALRVCAALGVTP
ncbi:MAG: FAD-dependent oxidoreductase [Desulfotignum sp.]|nr:FAD-dependent oxidoreductase [Desulfotignum sp.]MCF8137720.1 FAD-dependent oxidoreductase [Desulfotignum sp.]